MEKSIPVNFALAFKEKVIEERTGKHAQYISAFSLGSSGHDDPNPRRLHRQSPVENTSSPEAHKSQVFHLVGFPVAREKGDMATP